MYIFEMIPTWTLTLSILAAFFHGVTMLRLVDLKVPPYTIRGQPVRLECHYDLEGEALYSVKWFKDDKEFFRFLPEDDPPAQIFNQQGVFVDLPNSSDTAVVLKAVDINGSGQYRCEVSGEAPSFKTVTNQKVMVVIDLPDASGPQIEGVRPRYQIGDTVKINCTSSRSRPAAKLSWYINQEPVEESFLRHHPIIQDEDGLQTSMLGLEFKVRQKHFKKGDLKMKCLATIDTLYWRTNEQSVEGDRPQKAPVLESRETYSPEASAGTAIKLMSKGHMILLLAASLSVNLFSRLYIKDVLIVSLLISTLDTLWCSNKTQRDGSTSRCYNDKRVSSENVPTGVNNDDESHSSPGKKNTLPNTSSTEACKSSSWNLNLVKFNVIFKQSVINNVQ